MPEYTDCFLRQVLHDNTRIHRVLTQHTEISSHHKSVNLQIRKSKVNKRRGELTRHHFSRCLKAELWWVTGSGPLLSADIARATVVTY